ncbi:MAG: mechanosensitive ion channel family protein, partial [Myxococcota bacterium]
QNFKPLEERRIVFHFGVVYGTKAATLREIPGWIQAIIEGVEKTRFDRCHFQLFGESDLRFETVFFVLDPDYKTFMDIQQAINLGICEKLEEHSVDFAFPTRTLYHVTPPADVPLQPAAEIR